MTNERSWIFLVNISVKDKNNRLKLKSSVDNYSICNMPVHAKKFNENCCRWHVNEFPNNLRAWLMKIYRSKSTNKFNAAILFIIWDENAQAKECDPIDELSRSERFSSLFLLRKSIDIFNTHRFKKRILTSMMISRGVCKQEEENCKKSYF